MFGTVRPFQPELRHRESVQYKAVYCGLCHTLSERYGASARWLANYDFVLLAMLYWQSSCGMDKKRCMRHPFKKQPVCRGGPAPEYAADALMLFTDWSLRDTVRDEKGFRSLLARGLRRFYRKHFRRAAGRLPSEAEACRRRMEELWRLEGDKDASLDAPASAFGGMLACLSGFCGENRAAHSLLYHLGRWIYIVDAFEDRERDRRKGAYNAVNVRFDMAEGLDTVRDEVGFFLAREQDDALMAFDLTPEGPFTEIVRNILTLGLRARGHTALFGKKGGVE